MYLCTCVPDDVYLCTCVPVYPCLHSCPATLGGDFGPLPCRFRNAWMEVKIFATGFYAVLWDMSIDVAMQPVREVMCVGRHLTPLGSLCCRLYHADVLERGLRGT